MGFVSIASAQVETAGTACSGFSEAFWRLLFDAHDALPRCADANGVLAFATLASLAFAAFVVIDLLVAIVRHFGFAADEAGEFGMGDQGGVVITSIKAIGVIVFGMIAAWLVAFFAAVIDFLQMAPHTAVATGVLWQVTYAQLLARFGSTVKEDGGEPATNPHSPPLPAFEEMQTATEEVAE